MSLRRKALDSLKWSVLAEMAGKAIGPLVFLVVARILTPEDFGVVAAGTIVISFVQIFGDAGLSKALIQKQEHVDQYAHTAFWMNLGLSLAIYTLIWAAADFIAGFFNDPRITPVIRVLALQLPISALASVHAALLQRELNFRDLFFIRLYATVAPAAASLPLALAGAGYWALVAGVLAGQCVQVLALWKRNPWRPRLAFDKMRATELWRFGYWIVGEGLLSWFYIWADTLIAGKVLGTATMGAYKVGADIVLLVYGVLFSSLVPAIYSALAKVQSDREKVREVLGYLQFATGMLALPMAAAFLLFGEHVHLVLGEKWREAGIVVAVLGLTHGLAWLMGMFPEAYKAIGRPDVHTKMMMVSLIYYLPAYYFAARYGLHVLLWTRFALFVIGEGLQLYAAHALLAMSPLDIYRNVRSALSTALLSVCAYLFLLTFWPVRSLWDLAAHLVFFIAVNTGLAWLFYRRHFAVQWLVAAAR